ncbi:hypothetical protein D3C78_1254050 [compost metagenome]
MSLDDALDMWARWCVQGQIVSINSSGQTAMLMEILRTGITGPGHNGGGRAPILDGVEPKIEAALMSLAASGPVGHRRAKVLRTEYMVPVCEHGRAQEVRAIQLGMSLSMYKKDLMNARKVIRLALEGSPARLPSTPRQS